MSQPVHAEPAEAAVAAARWESSGHVRVDQAVAGLDELETRPTAQHADVYEGVHRRLHDALADLDGE